MVGHLAELQEQGRAPSSASTASATSAAALREGEILPAVLAHFGNNFMAVTVGYVLTEPTEAVTASLLIGLAAGFGLLGLVFRRRTAAAAPEPSPLSAVPARVTLSVGWWLKAAAFVAGALVLLIATAVIQQVFDGGLDIPGF